MNIETISPFDVLIWIGIFEQKAIWNVPINACNQESDANTVDKDHPNDELDNVEEAQTHNHAKQNRANYKHKSLIPTVFKYNHNRKDHTN